MRIVNFDSIFINTKLLLFPQMTKHQKKFVYVHDVNVLYAADLPLGSRGQLPLMQEFSVCVQGWDKMGGRMIATRSLGLCRVHPCRRA